MKHWKRQTFLGTVLSNPGNDTKPNFLANSSITIVDINYNKKSKDLII